MSLIKGCERLLFLSLFPFPKGPALSSSFLLPQLGQILASLIWALSQPPVPLPSTQAFFYSLVNPPHQAARFTSEDVSRVVTPHCLLFPVPKGSSQFAHSSSSLSDALPPTSLTPYSSSSNNMVTFMEHLLYVLLHG